MTLFYLLTLALHAGQMMRVSVRIASTVARQNGQRTHFISSGSAFSISSVITHKPSQSATSCSYCSSVSPLIVKDYPTTFSQPQLPVIRLWVLLIFLTTVLTFFAPHSGHFFEVNSQSASSDSGCESLSGLES